MRARMAGVIAARDALENSRLRPFGKGNELNEDALRAAAFLRARATHCAYAWPSGAGCKYSSSSFTCLSAPSGPAWNASGAACTQPSFIGDDASHHSIFAKVTLCFRKSVEL